MKTIKKNNKGFSLVELIVVILIMAIIAVALAPQVMKWVDESKISADNSNRATIKGAVDAAVADYMHEVGAIPASGYTFRIYEDKLTDKDGNEIEDTNIDIANPTGMEDYIAQVLNEQYLGVEQADGGCFRVEITKTGAVNVFIADASGVNVSGAN